MKIRNDIQVWWKQASRDFRSAKNSFNSTDYYVCALLCQQAVEKALKYLHFWKGKELLRVHDLVKLAKEADAPLDILQKCSEISPVYTEVRYPEGNELPASKVNKQEAEYILKLSQEILQWVKKQH